MAWSVESPFIVDHVDGYVFVCVTVCAPGCNMESWQAGLGSVMLRVMFAWKP